MPTICSSPRSWVRFSVVAVLCPLAACVGPERSDPSSGLAREEPVGGLDVSFFDDCAFVCVDFQPGTRHEMAPEDMPKQWRDTGFTVDDVNAATAFAFDVAHPNARRVADACRTLDLAMIFIHWGCRFADGMDLDPEIRRSFLREYGSDYDRWPHVASDGSNRPADFLAVRDGEYVIAKTGQDAFTSSNLEFVLRNLGVRRIVFVGGHTGACLGKTAASAKRLGFGTLCVQDATCDARESTRIPNLEATGYDHMLTTDEFLALVEVARQRPLQTGSVD